MCVRIPRVSTWVRHWSLRRKNMDISLAHTQRSAAIAQPIPTAIPIRTRQGAPNGVRWLACVSNNLCMQQPYYKYGSYSGSCILCIRMLWCNLDGHPRRKFQLRFSCWKSYFLLGQLGFGITGTRWFPTGNPTGETQRELLLLKSTGITPVKINGNYSCWNQLVVVQSNSPVTFNW